MKRHLILGFFLCLPLAAQAWNATGHRVVALLAWQQLAPDARQQLIQLLSAHPEFADWRQKAGLDDPALLLAEAAVWPDTLRHDRRYYDERTSTCDSAPKESCPQPIPGLPDQAQHRPWHYVDIDSRGNRLAGEVDRQIPRLSAELRYAQDPARVAYAIPWLLHLVADIHQPLHVGNGEDEGGNSLVADNPFDKESKPGTLHRLWDNLGGPSRLRGQKLWARAQTLLAHHPAPAAGDVLHWREESRALHATVYASVPQAGSGVFVPDMDYMNKAQATADQQLVHAGYRLGWLLAQSLKQRVSHGTRLTPP